LDKRLKEKQGNRFDPGKRCDSGTQLQVLGEEAAHRGDFRSAIRYLFQAVLVELGDRGILSEVTHRTHREQIAEFRSRMPQQVPLFESLVFHFEAVWYGQMPVGPAEYHQFRERVDKLLKGDATHATTG
jgi:hypothetical protein